MVDDRGNAAILPTPRTLNFSGYEWAINSGSIYRAGSRNCFEPANVWTDVNGALHLRISHSQGKWTAAEVKLTRSLGYGTYRFKVRDIPHLEPSAVLTLVSWDGVGTEQNRQELDVELSRWGYNNNDNATMWSSLTMFPPTLCDFESQLVSSRIPSTGNLDR